MSFARQPHLAAAFVALACLLWAAQGAVAQPSALTATCVACHGTTGKAPTPDFPHLAGQSVAYLVTQMQAIRSGERSAPLMVGMLDSMTDTDLHAIATFYSQQPRALGVADPDKVARGRAIYLGGTAKGVPACTACHAPDGLGLTASGYPLLAGQWDRYITARLEKYADMEQLADTDPRAIMRDITRRLTRSDMEAVASYIQGLR